MAWDCWDRLCGRDDCRTCGCTCELCNEWIEVCDCPDDDVDVAYPLSDDEEAMR